MLTAPAPAAADRIAYVTNNSSNSVTPIDIATHTAGTPIPVGSLPISVAITPDGKTAYVGNERSGSVTPIDIATHTASTPIPVGTSPAGVAIRADGKTAYVANAGSGSVTPIDIATNTAGTPITLSGAPFRVAITPDGKTAYVANEGTGSVTPIDIATHTAGTPITLGGSATGIAIMPDQAPTAAFTASAYGSATTGAEFEIDRLKDPRVPRASESLRNRRISRLHHFPPPGSDWEGWRARLLLWAAKEFVGRFCPSQ